MFVNVFSLQYVDDMIEKEYQEQVQFVLNRIKEERQKANMSQIELSFNSGLSQNQINCIESGRNIPNLYTIIKICAALQIKAKYRYLEHCYTEKESLRNEIISLLKQL